MPRPVFLDLTADQCDPERSAVAVLPVPYDATSTWHKGADVAPQAIIDASAELEDYDLETRTSPCEQGIATLDPVFCTGAPEKMVEMVRERVGAILSRSQLPVVLGGEHSVSIGAIQAVTAAFSGVTVLQIDAHGDTRDTYQGSKFNHACVMARAREMAPVVQVGLRAIDESEVAALDPERTWYAHEMLGDPGRSWVQQVVAVLTDRVYLTIDMDAFDPSLVPATGTPEPGGLGWYDVCALVDAVARHKSVVGFDVVELCPSPGQHASEFITAKLVYRTIAQILAHR